MAALAKRLIALLALIVVGGLGFDQAWADDAADADLPPVWAPTAYTVEAEAPPVGTSIINRRPKAAPAPIAPGSARGPARGAARASAPGRASATNARAAAAPQRRPTYRTAADSRPVRTAQAPPQAEVVEQAPIEPSDENTPLLDSDELQSTDPWCDEYMANGPDAVVCSSSEWLNNGRWFIDADLVLMHRANPKSRVVALDTTFPTTDNLNPVRSMTTANRGFHIEPGVRGTIGHFLGRDCENRDQSIEFTFLGPFDWQKSEGIQSAFPQRLFSPFDPGFVFDPAIPLRNAVYGGFAASDIQQYEYSSTLNSFELNLRTRYRLTRDCMTAMPNGTWSRQLDPGPTPSLLVGLRYYRVNEAFNWQSQRISDPSLGQANLDNATGNYDIDTANDLVGFQFGGDWTRSEKDYSFGGWIKMGGFVNFARQHSVVVIDDNYFSGDVNSNREGNEDVFTFAGEAGFSGTYHFNSNISLRGGLEMLWIQSVAVAPEQINYNLPPAPATVDLSGNVFFLGASVGLEVVW